MKIQDGNDGINNIYVSLLIRRNNKSPFERWSMTMRWIFLYTRTKSKFLDVSFSFVHGWTSNLLYFSSNFWIRKLRDSRCDRRTNFPLYVSYTCTHFSPLFSSTRYNLVRSVLSRLSKSHNFETIQSTYIIIYTTKDTKVLQEIMDRGQR